MYDEKALNFQARRIYQHFKGNLYYVFGLARHTETEESMVVYQALYGEHELFVRPYRMFIEEVSKEKDNPTGQKYRFEPYEKA